MPLQGKEIPQLSATLGNVGEKNYDSKVVEFEEEALNIFFFFFC